MVVSDGVCCHGDGRAVTAMRHVNQVDFTLCGSALSITMLCTLPQVELALPTETMFWSKVITTVYFFSVHRNDLPLPTAAQRSISKGPLREAATKSSSPSWPPFVMHEIVRAAPTATPVKPSLTKCTSNGSKKVPLVCADQVRPRSLDLRWRRRNQPRNPSPGFGKSIPCKPYGRIWSSSNLPRRCSCARLLRCRRKGRRN